MTSVRALTVCLLSLALGTAPGASRGADAGKVTFSKKPRPAQERTTVPEKLQPLLPWQGIYAAGGGVVSSAWRVVVTLEGDLRAGSNDKPGSSSIALVDKKRRKLDPAVLRDLIALADKAWREKRPLAAPGLADYSELLVVADGANVFLLDGMGPIRGGAAAELIKRLQAEAAK
jgi:hypothetical protein